MSNVAQKQPWHQRLCGAFVVYCACGQRVTGFQVDLGPDEEQDDGGMLMDALREGRRMEYRAGSPVHVSLGGPCECVEPKP